MIRIVFQNPDFIVCDKPAQVLSVPSRDRLDPRPCLGIALQNQLKTAVYPVHRLDYEVGGLILYALNSRSHRLSQDWFQQKTIRKKYQALTLAQDFAHWPHNIATDRQTLEVQVGQQFHWRTQILRGKRRSYESERGEWAETEAIVHQIYEQKIIWHLYPITGKPHQLRLELSRRGFPIIGDQLYGSQASWPQPGIALKAVEMDLSGITDRMGLPEKISLSEQELT